MRSSEEVKLKSLIKQPNGLGRSEKLTWECKSYGFLGFGEMTNCRDWNQHWGYLCHTHLKTSAGRSSAERWRRSSSGCVGTHH
jgi:hypothetical protein